METSDTDRRKYDGTFQTYRQSYQTTRHGTHISRYNASLHDKNSPQVCSGWVPRLPEGTWDFDIHFYRCLERRHVRILSITSLFVHPYHSLRTKGIYVSSNVSATWLFCQWSNQQKSRITQHIFFQCPYRCIYKEWGWYIIRKGNSRSPLQRHFIM